MPYQLRRCGQIVPPVQLTSTFPNVVPRDCSDADRANDNANDVQFCAKPDLLRDTLSEYLSLHEIDPPEKGHCDNYGTDQSQPVSPRTADYRPAQDQSSEDRCDDHCRVEHVGNNGWMRVERPKQISPDNPDNYVATDKFENRRNEQTRGHDVPESTVSAPQARRGVVKRIFRAPETKQCRHHTDQGSHSFASGYRVCVKYSCRSRHFVGVGFGVGPGNSYRGFSCCGSDFQKRRRAVIINYRNRLNL